MTWFHSFRGDHGFTFYGDQSSPVSLDKPLVAVVYVCVLLSGATLLATLGIRGREKWSHAIRASYAVAIASIILVCLMSHNWMVGRVHVTAPYVYRSNMHFSGTLSVHIGLKSANITLDGTYLSPSGGKQVYYVETLPWPSYGQERICYRHQLQRGLPGPILRVMDFLTYAQGDLQWGKAYHTAGGYAWGLLWTAFVFWLLSNLLLFSVVIYGAYMFFLAGLALLMACVAYSQTVIDQPLHMTFGPDVLKLEYGWSFWLAIVAGCLTTLLGILLIVTDYFLHPKVAEFFHLEKLAEDEDFSNKEDFPQPMNKPRFYHDARGFNSVTQGERRGSIFLDPSRQTNWTMHPTGTIKGNPFRPGGSPLQNARVNGLDADAKALPRYGSISNSFNTRSKSDSFLAGRDQLRSSCRGASDRKPSLATLKEHRENHVNEQRFNSCHSSGNNGAISNHSLQLQQQQRQRVGRFLSDAALSLQRRSASDTALDDADCVVNNRETNSQDSNNETVVEVVVESHHQPHRNGDSLFPGRPVALTKGCSSTTNSTRRQEEEEEEQEDCRVSRKSCFDCADILETTSSPGGSVSDDGVFFAADTNVTSRSSSSTTGSCPSRQASEGEEGEVVAVLPERLDSKATTGLLGDDKVITRNDSMIPGTDRHVSIPMGEL